MLAAYQSPQAEYDSAPLPSAPSTSRLNASVDVMSTAYTLFFPPDSRRQLPMNLPSQSLQQSLTGASLPHPNFTQQSSASIAYPPPSGTFPTPIHSQELEQQQQQQHRPQLVSVPRQHQYYYPPIRSSNDAADQDNTSTRLQKAWSKSQSPSNPLPQTAAQSYYSAASLMPPGYGLPLTNHQPGIPGPDMLETPAPTSSIPLPIAQTQTIPLYGPPHLMHPPEGQQPHLQQQQPSVQHSATGSHQDILFPTAESRSKMRRFRYVV
ncbi:hypothetical protein V1505DRAFT_363701 [Lipomyces doorenjongii]